MLLASLYYSWSVGNLQEYEATFLTHKIESIRLINKFIEGPKNNATEIREHIDSIATLCLIEVSRECRLSC